MGLQRQVRPDLADLRGCDGEFRFYCKSSEKPVENTE